jgi:putative transposase
MRDHDISQRRACDLVGVDAKTVRRERPPDHADIRKKCTRLRANAAGLGIGASG